MNSRSLVPSILIILSCGACSAPTASHLDITNGKPTLRHPAIVQLEDNGRTCTGTFILPNVLITAAHCIDNDLSPLSVAALGGASSKTVVDPAFDGTFPQHDVALAFFSRAVVDDVMNLDFNEPKIGDTVTMIGYGRNFYKTETQDAGLTGIKRIGSNNIIHVTDHAIAVIGTKDAFAPGLQQPDGTHSGLGRGDSGGPLLNQAGGIIGIASSSMPASGGQLESDFTKISTVRDFLTTQLAAAGRVEPAAFVTQCLKEGGSAIVKNMLGSSNVDGCESLYFSLASARLYLTNKDVAAKDSDLTILGTMPWLNMLSIDGFHPPTTAPLLRLTKLERLYLTDTGLHDFNFLANLPSLQSISIHETGDVDVAKLAAALPNLDYLMVNGELRPLLGSMRNERLAGRFVRSCAEVDQSDHVGRQQLFSLVEFTYNPSSHALDVTLRVFPDAACAQSPLMTLATKAMIKTIYPTANKDLWTLDLDDAFNSTLTIHDEGLFDPIFLKIRRELCGYRVGQPTACRHPNTIAPYTIFKIDGDKVYIGVIGRDETIDGYSRTRRHLELDDAPYIRTR
jgi:hypothetical protein